LRGKMKMGREAAGKGKPDRLKICTAVEIYTYS
jgi:hypothetical protein